MSYKKKDTHAGYYDDGYRYEGYGYYDDEGGYKKRKSYYYYVEKYFKGETKYDEIFKSTCTNSIENARVVYDSPLLQIEYKQNSDKAYTDLLRDEISIGEKHIKLIEKLLKSECKKNDIPYNDKRGLIDIFKFVYIHELSHIKYTKRLLAGKPLFESINSFEYDDINNMTINFDTKKIDYKDYEILCKDIVDGVIFQMMNMIEDIYINEHIISQKYKNQFFTNIHESILKNNRESEVYIYKFVDYALLELHTKGCNTIEKLADEIPTQHDFIMFIYNILVENKFKIKTNESLEDLLDTLLEELLPEKYKKQKLEKLEDTFETVITAKIIRERNNDEVNIAMLREEIKKIKQSVVKSLYNKVK